MLSIISGKKSAKQYNICHPLYPCSFWQTNAHLFSLFGVKFQSYRNIQFRHAMIREFEKLTDSEIDLLLKAPVLVCILVAGADGTIDKKEIKEAISQTRKKTSMTLAGYLNEVSQDFEDKLKILIQSYPHSATERGIVIMEELREIDAVFNKIERQYAAQIYQMLRELASKIASSSGGLWGMNTVTDEEAEYMRLSMIHDPLKV